MSKPRRDKDYLRDIREAARRIGGYTSGHSYKEFLSDTKTQDAVVRNLQIVGEAAKKVSGQLKRSNNQIPWKEMAGIRDKIVHEYFGVNYDIVWSIVKKELPPLLDRIKTILHTLE